MSVEDVDVAVVVVVVVVMVVELAEAGGRSSSLRKATRVCSRNLTDDMDAPNVARVFTTALARASISAVFHPRPLPPGLRIGVCSNASPLLLFPFPEAATPAVAVLVPLAVPFPFADPLPVAVPVALTAPDAVAVPPTPRVISAVSVTVMVMLDELGTVVSMSDEPGS